jgi:hypothetical protein
MQIKLKAILIMLVLIAVGCLSWFAFHAFKLFNESAEKTRYYSAMSWLNASIREELDDYYKAKGRYPTQLSDLTIPFLGDGANPEMLNNFKYVTDGIYYEITWEVRYGSEIDAYKEHVAKGKMLFTEHYINGKLVSKKDFGKGMEIPKSRFNDGNTVSEKKYSDD